MKRVTVDLPDNARCLYAGVLIPNVKGEWWSDPKYIYLPPKEKSVHYAYDGEEWTEIEVHKC